MRTCEGQLGPISTLINLVVSVAEAGGGNTNEHLARTRLRDQDIVAELVVLIELKSDSVK